MVCLIGLASGGVAYSASSYGRLDNLEEQKMTVETESNRKLAKFIETTSQKFDDVNTSLTSIQVNQARVEGEVKTLDVKIENLQKGQDEVKADLSAFKTETKENFKEVKADLSAFKKEVQSDLSAFKTETKENFKEVQSDLSAFKAETKENFKEVKAYLSAFKKEVQSDLSAFKTETKENFKEVQSELKETRKDISGLYKWVIGLIVTLGIGILTLGIGVVTIIFRVFDLLPS